MAYSRIQLIPIEYDNPVWLSVLKEIVPSIWEKRSEHILALFEEDFKNPPKTEQAYVIEFGAFVGITGYYQFDEKRLGLCWFGIAPWHQGFGFGSESFKKLKEIIRAERPEMKTIVELIPDDRAHELAPIFRHMGFRPTGETASANYTTYDTIWRVYEAPIT